MEKLTLDTGVKSYRINGGGVLRFNPSDPNVYARFMAATEAIKAMEQEISQWGDDPLQAMCKADREVKAQLQKVFGPENDFDQLLGGVNLLAVASNGERVITNLLNALQPVLTAGARRCAGEQVAAAAEKAQRRRESQ